jgi:hypothetical protein
MVASCFVRILYNVATNINVQFATNDQFRCITIFLVLMIAWHLLNVLSGMAVIDDTIGFSVLFHMFVTL